MIPGSRHRPRSLAWAVATTGAIFVGLGSTSSAVSPAIAGDIEINPSFAGEVLPIFEQRCAECHGGQDENGEIRTEASLNLLSYEGVMAGSEFGSVIEPGDAEGSYLLELIVEGDMPEEGDPVPAEEIDIIRAWIAAGAADN